MTGLQLSQASTRGPLSEALYARLLSTPQPAPELVACAASATRACDGSTLSDEDIQLSLTWIYELHYRGLAGVDERWEWHPDLLRASAVLERELERDLRRLTEARLPADQVAPGDIPNTLTGMIKADGAPSLSRYVSRHATSQELAEFLMHRSIYHLKEADPHTWAIPRLLGGPKAALVEIQADEYGGGDPRRMHSALFGLTMRKVGLDDTYGAYLDRLPASTLASVNAMTFLGLHRRLRGAVVGHLAAVEMDSSLPNRLYGNGLRRLGFDGPATVFFDEHVEADAVHEQIAAHDLAGQLARQDPALVPDILFGAAVALATGSLVSTQLLESWASGRSSLRVHLVPTPVAAAGATVSA